MNRQQVLHCHGFNSISGLSSRLRGRQVSVDSHLSAMEKDSFSVPKRKAFVVLCPRISDKRKSDELLTINIAYNYESIGIMSW
jgi:hypothetical protein